MYINFHFLPFICIATEEDNCIVVETFGIKKFNSTSECYCMLDNKYIAHAQISGFGYGMGM